MQGLQLGPDSMVEGIPLEALSRAPGQTVRPDLRALQVVGRARALAAP
jgi:hypothetical protein